MADSNETQRIRFGDNPAQVNSTGVESPAKKELPASFSEKYQEIDLEAEGVSAEDDLHRKKKQVCEIVSCSTLS
jgi:hypothetical protein